MSTTSRSTVRQPPQRQARAVANDRLILNTVETVLADEGWESASVLQIAEGSGLSRRSVLNRYGDRTGAAISAWDDRVSGPLLVHMEAVLDAVRAQRERPQGDRLATALEPFLAPATHLRVASELLAVSCHQPDIRFAIAQSLDPFLDRCLAPGRTLTSRSDAAQNAFALTLALGFLLESRTYPDDLVVDLSADLDHIAHALASPTSPRRLPTTTAAHLDTDPVLDSNPALARLLASTLTHVGEHGYESATIDRIARSIGVTSGMVFGYYPNKRELFLDATQRALSQALNSNMEFQQHLLSRYSPGVTDAVLTREFMAPHRRLLRTVVLEQYRLAWHDADIRAPLSAAQQQSLLQTMQTFPDLSESRARGRTFIALARGIGIGLLANLRPDVSPLPHDVVSIPLVEG